MIGYEWKELHFAEDSESLAAGNLKRYRIRGGPFKFFKIVQAGPCLGNDDDTKYRLRIMYFDLFGYATNSNSFLARKSCKSKPKVPSFSFSLIIALIL